jgi:hypothetical protein
MGEILDAFTEAFDTGRPDILDRLHHAQPLARGPYRRLIDDSIIEIERLRAELERRDRFEWDCPNCGIHVTSQVVGQ